MIDKNKAYRFRGDSERWVWHGLFLVLPESNKEAISKYTAEHIHKRGILLEYPELPGEDWEFCEKESAERFWNDGLGKWRDYGFLDGASIYCRKKKPVYRSGAVPFSTFKNIEFNETGYWTTDPEKGKELLS